MIDIDFKNEVYVCPYCGCKQSYSGEHTSETSGYRLNHRHTYQQKDVEVFHIHCTNKQCSNITVVARDVVTGKQFDLYPQKVFKSFPNYVPEPIRNDYIEGVLIMAESPKASATLFRRCLQGMIRNFWGIKESNLKSEIDKLQTKVSASQWKAIDGLRKLGNIGAHMEKDINLIIDIDEGEAQKLAKLIELLIDKWYVARHDEEELCSSIESIAEKKK